VFEGQELHAAPPGYHVLAFWFAFWPFSLVTALALPSLWSKRAEPAVRFCIAWIVPTWIAFEIAATKLPHYVLPAYPAIAMLTARAVADETGFIATRGWARVALAFWAFASCVLALAIAGAAFALDRRFEPLAIASALACLGLCAVAARTLAEHGLRMATASLVVAAAILYASGFGLVAPRLSSPWISSHVAALVSANRPCRDSRVLAVGYHEPSLVFALGTETILGGVPMAARHLVENRDCALVLTSSADEPALLEELERRSVVPLRLGEVRGFDYTTGRQTTVSLWRVAPPVR
jgi:4-amino-4-deoxy-L-arabinose transferase-like glycosyltransferase